MKYLLFVLVCALSLSGCVSSLRSLSQELKIPFVGESKTKTVSPSKQTVAPERKDKPAKRTTTATIPGPEAMKASLAEPALADRF